MKLKPWPKQTGTLDKTDRQPLRKPPQANQEKGERACAFDARGFESRHDFDRNRIALIPLYSLCVSVFMHTITKKSRKINPKTLPNELYLLFCLLVNCSPPANSKARMKKVIDKRGRRWRTQKNGVNETHFQTRL